MVICTNCGFQNQPGDEFCGNCGRYLEFSGNASEGHQRADGTTSSGQSTDGSEAPTTVGPTVGGTGAAGAGAGGAGGASGGGMAGGGGAVGGGAVGAGPALRGSAPEVICWNCGRRNPAGRAFCMQCGTKLTTDSGAAAGAAGGAGAAGAGGGVVYGSGSRGYPPGGYPPPGGNGGGGGSRRLTAILGGMLALLVLAALGAFALGLFSGPPGPTSVAVISPSPSAGASVSASGLASSSPVASATFGASLGGVTLAPPTVVAITVPPPTEAPTPGRTRRPPCDATGQPPGCRPTRPPATPTMEPTPTAAPTPLDCSVATGTPNMFSLTVEAPTRQVPAQFAWCIREVTFTNLSNPGATGTLKVYLENDEFVGPPGNYGMARIGWPGDGGACEASIENNFTGSNTYTPQCAYPFGYDYMPPGTLLDFAIDNCGTNGTCSGYVTIRFERVPAPPPPQP